MITRYGEDEVVTVPRDTEAATVVSIVLQTLYPIFQKRLWLR